MKNSIKANAHKREVDTSNSEKIKVQLDGRTSIMLSRMSSLKVWKQRYPNARIIS